VLSIIGNWFFGSAGLGFLGWGLFSGEGFKVVNDFNVLTLKKLLPESQVKMAHPWRKLQVLSTYNLCRKCESHEQGQVRSTGILKWKAQH